MNRSRRFALAIASAVALLALAMPAEVRAELCLSNADCPSSPLGGGRTCVRQTVVGLGMFWGNCTVRNACNTGRECIPGAECRDGVCQRPAGTCVLESDCADDQRCSGGRCESTRPSGGGTGMSGEGRRCMPANGSKPAGWAQDRSGKPLGACPSGTQCNPQGYCVRLAT
jgi:hypothetical protein